MLLLQSQSRSFIGGDENVRPRLIDSLGNDETVLA
jgi:hypothetical protein